LVSGQETKEQVFMLLEQQEAQDMVNGTRFGCWQKEQSRGLVVEYRVLQLIRRDGSFNIRPSKFSAVGAADSASSLSFSSPLVGTSIQRPFISDDGMSVWTLGTH
jgi:hypothetical protein